MKLHKRTIRIPAGKIIQLMLENGKIVAEFHDPDLYAMMTFPAGVSVYNEDTCQFDVGTLGEMLG